MSDIDFHSDEWDVMRQIEAYAAKHIMGLSVHRGSMQYWHSPTECGYTPSKSTKLHHRRSYEDWVIDTGRKRELTSSAAICEPVPSYLTDANADVALLEHVRREWAYSEEREYVSRFHQFATELHELQYQRKDGSWPTEVTPACYKRGDYTRAACIVVAQNETTENPA